MPAYQVLAAVQADAEAILHVLLVILVTIIQLASSVIAMVFAIPEKIVVVEIACVLPELAV